MAELTDNVEILRNAVIDYRDRVVPDIWAERNLYREALERAARLAEHEPESLVGQVVREALDVRPGGASAPAPPTAEREDTT